MKSQRCGVQGFDLTDSRAPRNQRIPKRPNLLSQRTNDAQPGDGNASHGLDYAPLPVEDFLPICFSSRSTISLTVLMLRASSSGMSILNSPSSSNSMLILSSESIPNSSSDASALMVSGAMLFTEA